MADSLEPWHLAEADRHTQRNKARADHARAGRTLQCRSATQESYLCRHRTSGSCSASPRT
jgi:hypothetical protein